MILRRLFPRDLPPLDWVQVEVTTHCNAACIYCPRTVFKRAWRNRHLPVETFETILSQLRHCRHVHLQGWGEPFLHPDLFAMVALAKERGLAVGTTTNGILLDEGMALRLVTSGVDVIALSLAGASGKNDAIRKGTRLRGVLDAVRRLERARERNGSKTPAIHVAYMLFRSGLEDLPHLIPLLLGLDVQHVVISVLDFALSPELERETLRPVTREEHEGLRVRLDEVVTEGARGGLGVSYYLGFKGSLRKDGCTENIHRALCVASDGAVSPCVYTDLDLEGASRWVDREAQPYQRLVFGNVDHGPLSGIWWDKAYVNFRNSFGSGKLWAPCRGCPKLWAG